MSDIATSKQSKVANMPRRTLLVGLLVGMWMATGVVLFVWGCHPNGPDPYNGFVIFMFSLPLLATALTVTAAPKRRPKASPHDEAAPAVDVQTVGWVCDWLRSDDAEKIRQDALDSDVPPEDALAHQLEQLFPTAADTSQNHP